MGLGTCPRVWVSKPSPIPCLSWAYNLKLLCKLGDSSLVREPTPAFPERYQMLPDNPLLIQNVQSPFVARNCSVVLLWVQSLESKFGRTLLSLGTHKTAFGFSGIFSVAMACFLSTIKLLVPYFSWYPSYATSWLQFWALWGDTLYSLFAKWFRMVLNKQSS